MSKRVELKRRRLEQTRWRQGAVIVGTVVLALAVIGYVIYQDTRPIGELVAIAKETLPFADGKALGPADAPITILEFSDFQ